MCLHVYEPKLLKTTLKQCMNNIKTRARTDLLPFHLCHTVFIHAIYTTTNTENLGKQVKVQGNSCLKCFMTFLSHHRLVHIVQCSTLYTYYRYTRMLLYLQKFVYVSIIYHIIKFKVNECLSRKFYFKFLRYVSRYVI